MGGLLCCFCWRNKCETDEESTLCTEELNEHSRESYDFTSNTDKWNDDSINVNIGSNIINSATNTAQADFQTELNTRYDDFHSLLVHSVLSNCAKTGVNKTENDNDTRRAEKSKNVIIAHRNYSTTSRDFPPLVHALPSNHETNSNVNRPVWNIGINQEKIPPFHPDMYSDLKNGMYDSNYFPISHRRILSSTSPIYKVVPVYENGCEYWNIKRRITNRYFKVHSIDKIENQLLERSYSLKKEQKLKHFPYLEEVELFHGTKWAHADNICKNNFNWRFSGKEVGHIFGRGVCFSCNAMYASNYSDKDEGEKVMFIAKVMIGRKCVGKYNMKLPPAGCDTSTKQSDNIVVVKYEDNEYYPIYRITFHIDPGYVPFKQRDGVKPSMNK